MIVVFPELTWLNPFPISSSILKLMEHPVAPDFRLWLYHGYDPLCCELLKITNNIWSFKSFISAYNKMYMVAHNTPGINAQPLLFYAIVQWVAQRQFVRPSCKEVYPSYHRKGDKIKRILVGYNVAFAWHNDDYLTTCFPHCKCFYLIILAANKDELGKCKITVKSETRYTTHNASHFELTTGKWEVPRKTGALAARDISVVTSFDVTYFIDGFMRRFKGERSKVKSQRPKVKPDTPSTTHNAGHFELTTGKWEVPRKTGALATIDISLVTSFDVTHFVDGFMRRFKGERSKVKSQSSIVKSETRYTTHNASHFELTTGKWEFPRRTDAPTTRDISVVTSFDVTHFVDGICEEI